MSGSSATPIILLDTDVFSFLLKGDSRGTLYIPLLTGYRLALSFMTVAEVFQWAALHNWGSRRITRMEQTLKSYIILPADIEICQIWGALRAERKAAGRPISPQDAWVAAVALRHKLPLVTHNGKDFQGITNLDVRIATP